MSENLKKKVLIVDDASFARNRIKKIVESTSFAEVVGEAKDGDEAVSLFKKLKPDLVTMDLVMPNADGFKAIEEIMKIDKNANIIVISVVGQELTIKDIINKGAKEYIKKPFKEEQVYNSLKRLLNH